MAAPPPVNLYGIFVWRCLYANACTQISAYDSMCIDRPGPPPSEPPPPLRASVGLLGSASPRGSLDSIPPPPPPPSAASRRGRACVHLHAQRRNPCAFPRSVVPTPPYKRIQSGVETRAHSRTKRRRSALMFPCKIAGNRRAPAAAFPAQAPRKAPRFTATASRQNVHKTTTHH